MNDISPQGVKDWYNNPDNHGTFGVIAIESNGKIDRRILRSDQLRVASKPYLAMLEAGKGSPDGTSWFEAIGLTYEAAEEFIAKKAQ